MNILRCIAFSKIIQNLSFTTFFALQVKEKCVRGQGEVSQGSRRSAPVVKEKCVRGQGKVLQLNTTHSVEALLLDPQCTSPLPLTHFSLTPDALLLDLEGFFFRVEKKQQQTKVKENPKLFLKTLFILKCSYALVVKSYFSTWESF